MGLEYVVYCDDSVSRGDHFSNFYGGALVRSDHLETVKQALADRKADLNLTGEVKWQKISTAYADKYISLMETFFDFIEAGQIKFRVMFTQNMFQAARLTAEQRDNAYFMLYYQFVKHGFGFSYRPPDFPAKVRLNLDQIPDTREKAEQFRSFIAALTINAQFRAAALRIEKSDIADVDSKRHDVLQCLDVVPGSMQFRLNDKHKIMPEGKKRRAKRTIAKEKVYKYILSRIRIIYPNFNIGISTGIAGDRSNRWHHSYRHWLFIPSDAVIVGGSKRAKAG